MLNIPLSSDTNQVTALYCNVNISASYTCLEAVKQEAVGHSQLEAHNERAEVFTPAFSSNSMTGISLHELIRAGLRSQSTCGASPYATASKNSSSGCLATSQTISAGTRSEGAHTDHLHSSQDESYLATLLSLYDSMKDESIALLIRSLIDCVHKVNDLCCGVDSEAIKYSIQDIDSVVQKIASLCEKKTYA